MAEKYTKAQVITAIRGSHGIIAAVARKLGCERATVYRYVKTYPAVEESLEQERETLLDAAEAMLYKKAIQEGDTTSLIFLLKTVGKRRGYVERQDITSGDQPLRPEVVVYLPASPRSDDYGSR